MSEIKVKSNVLLVFMLLFQLILPVLVAAENSSVNNDAIEPEVVEVQSLDEDIESTKLSDVTDEDIGDEKEETIEVNEKESSTVEEEVKKPVEDKNKPNEKEKQEENKSPPVEEEKVEDEKEEPSETEKPEVEEDDVEEDVEEDEYNPGAMLDGFPATPHPDNPASIIRYAQGSLGSAFALLSGARMMTPNADVLAPGEVRTSKTATPVPGMVNTWDITVRVEGRDDVQVEKTDIVLVIDRSGSMADNNRMANAKSAAINFINTMIPADDNLRIAIVSYSSSYQGAQLVTVNREFTRNINQLTSSVNSLTALGGTHTQAGIIQGQSLLTGSGADNKYMVLLSDGEPTYSYEPSNWTNGRPTWGTAGTVGNNNQRTGVYDGNFNTGTIVGTGSDVTQSYNFRPSQTTYRRHIHNGLAAIKAGQDAQVSIGNSGVLFTIAVEAGTQGTSILEDIASQGFAYSTQNPGELQEIYDRIATQIATQYALRFPSVIDEMGDGFTLIESTLNKTEGVTSVVPATGSSNQTINWDISPTVTTLVPGSTDVRYAEMTYRVEVNDDILELPGAKTDEHKLFNTNKLTELSYTDTNDENQTKPIESPEVDPVLLRIKKNLLDADSNEARRFNVRIANSTEDYNELVELIPNGDYLWLTTLRHEGTYTVEEVSVSGNPSTPLDQFIINYDVDGTTGTTFDVYHDGAIPRGDIVIEVTNREIKKIDITGTKVWEGGPAEKPSVTLQLYRNGTAHLAPVTLTHPTTTYTWANLDEVNANGDLYIYTVKEVNPPTGYLSSSSGLTVTNVYQIPSDGVATAIKIWQGSNPDDFSAVPLTLWRTLDGDTFEVVPNVSPTITQDPIVNPNEHTYHYVWEDLVETDFYGNEYTFYFTEDQVLDSYERDYLDTTASGMVDGILTTFALSGGRVLNREMNLDFQFTKVNEVGQALEGAVFELHRHDGQDRILVQRLGDVTPISVFNFTGLAKGTYTLTEVSVPDGYALPDDNTWTFEVVWNDTDKKLDIVFETGDQIDGEIANYPMGMLPETGGPGNTVYLITSLISLLSFMLIYIWRKKEDGGLNMTKKISIFFMLFLSMASFGALNSNTAEAAIGDDTTFILHKLLFDFDKMPAGIQNDGYENLAYDDYVTLPGAEFDVYDVTAEFVNRARAEKALETANIQAELATLDLTDRIPITSGTTNVNGEVRFTLPSNDGVTAYLFHESRVPNGVRERAANMVVILPFLNKEDEVLSTIHLYPKNESEVLPFEKEVIGDVSYGIGERITYEIRTKVPKNPQDYELFRISDSADDVLEFYPDSLQVKFGNTIISPNDIYTMDSAANGFTLNFNTDYLHDYRDEDITIRYEMTLSEDAIADVNYLNEGSLQYDNNILIDRDIVRTGGYRFVKVDIRDETRTLADAHFILRNSESNYLVKDNGSYIWVADKKQASIFISDAEGSILISGLKYGRYFLEETKAPFRYVLSETPVAFNITNGTYNSRALMRIVNQPERPRLPITGGDVTPPQPKPKPVPSRPVSPTRPTLPITRGEEEVERPRLPRTGESANRMIMVTGSILIALAVMLLTIDNGKRRKEK